MKKNIIKGLLILYVLFLIWTILLKTDFSFDIVRRAREINLIPFCYENVVEGDIPWMEALANFLIFVPFGFLLRKSLSIKTRRCLIITAGLSLFFEVIQYMLAIGVADITDFITNTLGGALGIRLAQGLQKSKKQ